MTIQNRPPKPSSEKPNLIVDLLHKLKCTSKKVTLVGISGLVVVIGGYWGLQVLVKQKLPPFLENQIGNIIARPLDLGEVKGFSLNGIRFGTTTIPATVTDPDYVTVEEIKVSFNIFPVIFRRTLPVEATLVQPKVYAKQEQNGQWLNLDFWQSQQDEQPEPLIYIDVSVDVEEGDLTAIPYNHSPIKVAINGNGKYNTNNTQIEYDLEAAIAKAKATIQGATIIETGKTDTKLLIKNLALSNVATLLPNPPVNLSSGTLNANLELNIPSLAELNSTNVQGMISWQELSGEVTDLSAPIKARSRLNFGGNKAQIESTQASIGDITAQLAGTVNWQQGYDLTIEVLPFRLSSLAKIWPRDLPVDATGEVTAQLQVTGEITKPVVTGKLKNTKTLRVAKTPFKDIRANFTADLNRFVLDNLDLIPLAGGIITARGKIATNLQDFLARERGLDLEKMPVNIDLTAELPTKEIVAPYYQLPAPIEVGSLIATGKVKGTISAPEALVQWQIPPETTSRSEKNNVSGTGEIALIHQNLLVQDMALKLGAGKIEIEGQSNLQTKTWQSNLKASSLALTPFVAQLPLNGVNLDRPINLNNANAQFKGKLDELNPNKIQGVAELNLDVDGGDVVVNSQLDKGKIQANAVTRKIAVDKFRPNLPLPTQIQSARLDLSGRLQQLLEFSQAPNLNSIDANLNANLAMAEGTVIARGKLNNNQWQTNINAANLNTNYLLDTLVPNHPQLPKLDNLNAQVDLTGSINPLLEREINLPIRVNNASLQTGNQSLAARGHLIISNLTTQPDVASANLDINTQIDFHSLPIDKIVAQATSNNPLVAKSIDLTGNAQFQGKLQGKNLISAPTKPGNVSLTGDVRLENFAFNNTVFEPVMTGNLIAKTEEKMAINLQGKQDVIAAALESCTANRCRFLYLPTRVELRQGENTTQPVIAEGRKQGDMFSLDLVNFPLALLNLSPAQTLGIRGALKGKVTGAVNANLYSLATKGELAVERPAIGYIEADRFNAKFDYNPEGNIAEVATASFDFGKSKYNFQGGVNLSSGELEGKLNIPQAYIQDILTTFRWFTLEDLTRLWETPDYAQPTAVKPGEIITANESITAQLDRLRAIENKIQALAKTKQQGSLPSLLDIEGNYQGEITLEGTIINPQVGFRIEGNNWQWHTQPGFVDIVQPLGLVKQESIVIALDQLLIEGEFQNEKVNLDTATIQVEDAILSLDGELSANQQNANFQVQNLTVNTIEKFTTLPVNLTGAIDTAGRLTGTLSKPQLEGQITFADGSFNGAVLPLTIAGNYNYKDRLLTFKTNEPSYIQIEASVPYPIEPGTSDRVYADLELTSEAFSLLSTLTSNNLTWISGEGTANLQGIGRLDFKRKHILYDLNATGEVNLDNATIKSAYFEEPLIATGKITLNNQVATVETLQGKFAEKSLSVTGSLPILSAVSNLASPLTINLPPGAIDIQELYQGEVSGEVMLTGAALSPMLSGEVSLQNGQVFIPENTSDDSPAETEAMVATNSQAQSPAVIVELDNFHVNIADVKLQQIPLYEFKARGDLTLNGTLNDIPSLQAGGQIELTEGYLNLLRNEFSLVRWQENVIVFNPEARIINPRLDIHMKTEVPLLSETRLRSRQLNQGSNEIAAPIAAAGNAQVLIVNLDLDGEAREILPDLGREPSGYCRFRSDNETLTGEVSYTQAQFNRLAKCISVAALNNGSDRQLLNSPPITFSSTPDRSEGEIINLLGNRSIEFLEELGNANSRELFNLGATQLGIASIQRRLFNRVDDAVVNAGQKIGLDYLRIFPYVEGVYEINQDSSIRTIYSYPYDLDGDFKNSDNEFKVEYQLKF